MDLKAKIDENNENLKKLSGNIIKMSALKNIGIDKLYEKITEMFNLNEINLDNENVITNVRQKNLITKAIENVKRLKKQSNKNANRYCSNFYKRYFRGFRQNYR